MRSLFTVATDKTGTGRDEYCIARTASSNGYSLELGPETVLTVLLGSTVPETQPKGATTMDHQLAKELAALIRLGVSELRLKYAEVFAEPTRTGNKNWLVRRIAWRLQALAEGDLSERA